MTARAEIKISVGDNFWCIQVYETAAKNRGALLSFRTAVWRSDLSSSVILRSV